MTDQPLLEVTDLETHYPITEGILRRETGRVRAVDGISFSIDRGETFGLVGESGCGKSTTATTVLGLEEPTAGTVRFDGVDIADHDAGQRKRFRRRAQILFQDPDSSFDPRMTIGESIAEPLVVHGIRDRERRRQLVGELLERVGLQATDMDRYPHEFSGGQTQRIALARALIVNPELLVADEPVSSLDVSIQAEILSMISDLQAEFGLSLLFISHNLAVVREICDRVGVMYLGEIVELGPTEALFSSPQHPYTQALVSSIPTPDPHQRGGNRDRRLTGESPSPENPPQGCRFHTRCPDVIQPTDIDLEQAVWRRLVDFTRSVHTRTLEPAAINDAVADDRAGSAEAVTREAFDARLRSEFELPQSIEDERAESTVEAAITDIYEGDLEAASARLEETLETVCRREEPVSVGVRVGVEAEAAGQSDSKTNTADHRVACHLFDQGSAVTNDGSGTSN